MTVDPIEVVEAAYELGLDDRAWLANIAKKVRPLLDGGTGIVAHEFDVARQVLAPEDALLFGVSQESWTSIRQAIDASINAAMLSTPEPFGSSTDTARKLGIDLRKYASTTPQMARLGFRDSVALSTIEPGGRGIMIYGFWREEFRATRGQKRLWTRVSAHIAAGRRLRSAPDDEEAILTPSGKLDDARGEATSRSARDALRDAVMRVEKARGRARREDPERATEAWTALVAGRWSLVDRFERGGRRFLVARPNTHQLEDPRALTERERSVAHLAALGKSNKLIAYELGIAASTVAMHLAAAMRKLGVRTRVDLIQAIARFAR